MTATRDRRSDPEIDAELAWDDRPIIGQFRGLPWWAAVLVAFGLTTIAAFVDMQQQDTLGKIYQGAFVVGCIAAVCLVRRRSLFGPMVQPPLIFAITAVGAIALLSEKASGGGLKALLLSVALPLTSNFPTMGITTAVVVLIGLYRWWRERDPDPEMRPNTPRQRGADIGLDDEPGQRIGRGRERSGKDRTAAPPRRGRPEMEELPPPDDHAARRGGRTPRPSREPAPGRDGGRDAGREPRRRDSGAGRPERGRSEPPEDKPVRGRGRGGESPSRRREPGAEERGRRDTGRDGGREGRGGTSGRQPRRRPPESPR